MPPNKVSVGEDALGGQARSSRPTPGAARQELMAAAPEVRPLQLLFDSLSEFGFDDIGGGADADALSDDELALRSKIEERFYEDLATLRLAAESTGPVVPVGGLSAEDVRALRALHAVEASEPEALAK